MEDTLLTYFVATTLDGRIAHEDGSYSGFATDGDHVQAFLEALGGFRTVLMGRKTYELGIAAGLEPGQPAYPGMRNVVFSSTLEAPDSEHFRLVRGAPQEAVARMKSEGDGPIWLCGGGVLAGALLRAGLVDRLVIKLNPTIFGAGVPLVDHLDARVDLRWLETRTFDSGVVFVAYAVE